MWVGCSAGVLESLTRLRPQKVVQFSYSVVILELNSMPNPRLEVLIKKCFLVSMLSPRYCMSRIC